MDGVTKRPQNRRNCRGKKIPSSLWSCEEPKVEEGDSAQVDFDADVGRGAGQSGGRKQIFFVLLLTSNPSFVCSCRYMADDVRPSVKPI
jgi:hypothetical protein